jgi:hypothetical protein
MNTLHRRVVKTDKTLAEVQAEFKGRPVHVMDMQNGTFSIEGPYKTQRCWIDTIAFNLNPEAFL